MKSGCAAGDAEDLAYVPSALAPRRPFQALELSWRKGNAVHQPIGDNFSARMRVEVESHELEDASVALDAALEHGTSLLGCIGDGGYGPTAVMDGNRKSVADAEEGRVIEKLKLLRRQG